MEASTSQLPQLPAENIEFLNQFWQKLFATAENEEVDFKRPSIPLARIKKSGQVMKTSDPDVKMIAAEVPIVFSKACEAFIAELTLRAWQEAEKDKRKTITRADLHKAARKDPMFDFLIDFIPKEVLGKKEPDKQPNRRQSHSIDEQMAMSAST